MLLADIYTLVSSDSAVLAAGRNIVAMNEHSKDTMEEEENEEDKMIVIFLGSSSLLFTLYCLLNQIFS